MNKHAGYFVLRIAGVFGLSTTAAAAVKVSHPQLQLRQLQLLLHLPLPSPHMHAPDSFEPIVNKREFYIRLSTVVIHYNNKQHWVSRFVHIPPVLLRYSFIVYPSSPSSIHVESSQISLSLEINAGIEFMISIHARMSVAR